MNTVVIKTLRAACLLFIFAIASPLAVSAQDVKLQLDNLDKFESRASESVDVTLDGTILRIAISLLRERKPEEAAIKELVIGLKGVYVKGFQFDKDGEYSSADVDVIRTQLRGPGWSKMAGVKSKKEGENVEVYMMMSGSQVNGIAVIAADPKQLFVVNIVGSIDLEKLMKLSGKFGIPSIQITTGNK